MAGRTDPEWRRMRQRVWRASDKACAWCGIDLTRSSWHLDHVVSRKAMEDAGYTASEIAEIERDPASYVIACPTCNSSRGARLGPPKTRNRDSAPRVFVAPVTAPVGRLPGSLWTIPPRGA